MTDKAELALLIDYYGAFLTERQREFARMSSDEDMSLAEIAEQAGVSRQAVRDSLAKAANQLRSFEQRLGLLERDRRLKAIAEELKSSLQTEDPNEIKEKVRETAQRLSELIGQ